jgi:GntR family mannosyl-D-glycerate transport/metabolism transcriptional repressor
VRQALKLLTEEQIIESIQGSGSYVKKSALITTSTSSRVLRKLADRNVDTHSDVKILK